MKSNVFSRSLRHGFTLVEVCLSLAIAAFCLISLLGLIPVGIVSNQHVFEQTAVAGIVSGIVEDLRTVSRQTSPVNQISPRYHFIIPATGTETQTLFVSQDGGATGELNADAKPSANPKYRVTLQFTADNRATSARILITWPALADRMASSSPSHFSGSYEAIVLLNR